MRTKTGTIEIKCDGCPALIVIDQHGVPPAGWGRVTFEEYMGPRGIVGLSYDLCDRCVATLPWRRP